MPARQSQATGGVFSVVMIFELRVIYIFICESKIIKAVSGHIVLSMFLIPQPVPNMRTQRPQIQTAQNLVIVETPQKVNKGSTDTVLVWSLPDLPLQQQKLPENLCFLKRFGLQCPHHR